MYNNYQYFWERKWYAFQLSSQDKVKIMTSLKCAASVTQERNRPQGMKMKQNYEWDMNAM